jgi:hypothetical protein
MAPETFEEGAFDTLRERARPKQQHHTMSQVGISCAAFGTWLPELTRSISWC